MTDVMYRILNQLCNRKMLASSIVIRARIILLAFEKLQNTQIAEILGLERHCVGRWRKRWQASWDALLAIQMNESKAALERAIIDTLRDAHRSGAPGKFTAEQIVQLMSTACEDPRDSNRPIDDWTGRELADEVHKRGIVESISVSRVNDFLRRVHLKPQQNKYWCFTTEKDHELFQSQVEAVCQTYLKANSAYQNNTHTVCVDEMTSLQANERRAPRKRVRPGQVAKTECQYNRHGTLSLTGSWHVTEGQMIHTTISSTRSADEFAKHLAETIRIDPDAHWIIVLDNLNTHCSEPVVRMVAKLLGIREAGLGSRKKRRGILGSMKSRREFLTNPDHRIRFVYTPKHSSWLNQIEPIFGIIRNRVMRNGSFTSQADLQEKLLAFVEYFNKTYAKPLNWSYQGRPTKSNHYKRPRTWRENTRNRKFEKIIALAA